MRAVRRIDQVVVVLPCTTGAEWFQRLAPADWHCCFVQGANPLVIAYFGARTAAFKTALSAVGVVMVAAP